MKTFHIEFRSEGLKPVTLTNIFSCHFQSPFWCFYTTDKSNSLCAAYNCEEVKFIREVLPKEFSESTLK